MSCCSAETVLTSLLLKQTRKSPDAVAVVDTTSGVRLTYNELQQAITRFVFEFSVSTLPPPSCEQLFVGIFGECSLSFIIACISLMTVGVACLPLGHCCTNALNVVESVSNIPRSHILCILVPLRLKSSASVRNLKRQTPATPIFFLSSDGKLVGPVNTVGKEPNFPRDVLAYSEVTSQTIAYCMCTSGTTRSSRNVVLVPHCCVVPNILDLSALFAVAVGDVFPLLAAVTFDVFIADLFIALSCGATVVTVAEQLKSQPIKLCQLLLEKRATIISCTPSLLVLLGCDQLCKLLRGQGGDQSIGGTVRLLAVGGEKCPPVHTLCQLLDGIDAGGHGTHLVRVVLLYGITELSVWASAKEITSASTPYRDHCSLGSPLTDTYFKVRKRNLTSDSSVQGRSLWVGGSFRVCRVYNSDGVEIPPKIYRSHPSIYFRPTNDIVLCETTAGPAQSLYFYGRENNLVKILGKQIQLEEVAAQFGAVAPCHIICVEPPVSGWPVRIVAFLAGDRQNMNLWKRANVEASALPEVARPDIVIVPSFPLTANGKVDAKQLRRLYDTHLKKKLKASPERCADRASWRHYLWNIWRQFLDIQECTSAQDKSFFLAAGGSSISAMHLCLALTQLFVVDKDASSRVLEALLQSVLNDSFEAFVDTFLSVHRGLDSHLTPSKQRFECNNEEISGSIVWSVSRMGHKFLHGKSCSTEKPAWTTPTNIHVKWAVGMKKCIDSSPLVCGLKSADHENNAVVFIGSHAGLFAAICAATGQKLWEVCLPDRIESSCCLSKDAQYCFVGCYDGKLYKISTKNGSVCGFYQTGMAIKSSPSVFLSTVWVGSHDHRLHAVNIEGMQALASIDTNGAIYSSPCICDSNRRLFVGNHKGILFCVSVETAVVVWEFACYAPIFSSPCCNREHVFVGCCSGKLFCLAQLSGEVIWSYSTQAPVFSSPSLNSGCLAIGSHDNCLYCLDAATGKRIWSVTLNAPVFSSPFLMFSPASPMKTQTLPLIVCCTTRGTVFIVQNGQILTSHKLGREVYSSPVVFRNQIFVGCRDNCLYCLEYCNAV